MKNHRIKKVTYSSGRVFYYPQYRWCFLWLYFYNCVEEKVCFPALEIAESFIAERSVRVTESKIINV